MSGAAADRVKEQQCIAPSDCVIRCCVVSAGHDSTVSKLGAISASNDARILLISCCYAGLDVWYDVGVTLSLLDAILSGSELEIRWEKLPYTRIQDL